MNALIVDDELDYRLLLGRVLSHKGFRVFLAENGRDALHKMRMAKMDIIIADVYMPVMDGYALHNTVRLMEGYSTIPFLFISAYEDDPSRKSSRNPKLDGFHKKERPVEELLGWIKFLVTPQPQRTPVYPLRTIQSQPSARRPENIGVMRGQIVDSK